MSGPHIHDEEQGGIVCCGASLSHFREPIVLDDLEKLASYNPAATANTSHRAALANLLTKVSILPAMILSGHGLSSGRFSSRTRRVMPATTAPTRGVMKPPCLCSPSASELSRPDLVETKPADRQPSLPVVPQTLGLHGHRLGRHRALLPPEAPAHGDRAPHGQAAGCRLLVPVGCVPAPRHGQLYQ